MSAPQVYSLPLEQIEPFLERRRYSAFVPARLHVDDFLRQILSKANDFVPSAAGSILMDKPHERSSDSAETRLHFVAAFGPSANELIGRSLPASQGVVGYVYRTGTPYRMEDAENDPNFYEKFDQTSAFISSTIIGVPIRIERTVCGVIELINRSDGGRYTAKDLQLLEIFAGYTSLSIENLLDAQRANEMARLDDLTGLYNDRFFHHRLTEDLVRADVTGSSVALIFLDLDNFKDVNDTHGHLAGSQVLKEFGYLLKQTVLEPGATLARYGGDEFVLILPDLDVDRAMAVAASIEAALSETAFLQGSFSWTDGPVYWSRSLTCSLGVAVYPDHVPRRGTTDLKKNLLLRAADQAMYRAKEAGKAQVRLAGPSPNP